MELDDFLKSLPVRKGMVIIPTLNGKIAEGMGLKYLAPCRIVVDAGWGYGDQTAPIIKLEGRVMGDNGKPGTVREIMLKRSPPQLQYQYVPGWTIVGEYDGPVGINQQRMIGLPKKITRLQIGESLAIPVSHYPPASVKTAVSRRASGLGRQYAVELRENETVVTRVPWVEPEKRTRDSFTDQIRSMGVGDIWGILKSDKSIETVRAIVGRLTTAENMKFTVNRTPDGCKITRLK